MTDINPSDTRRTTVQRASARCDEIIEDLYRTIEHVAAVKGIINTSNTMPLDNWATLRDIDVVADSARATRRNADALLRIVIVVDGAEEESSDR